MSNHLNTPSARLDTTASEVKAFLVKSGYSIYRYRTGQLEPVGLDARHPVSEDLFAFRPSHVEKYEIPTVEAAHALLSGRGHSMSDSCGD